MHSGMMYPYYATTRCSGLRFVVDVVSGTLQHLRMKSTLLQNTSHYSYFHLTMAEAWCFTHTLNLIFS